MSSNRNPSCTGKGAFLYRLLDADRAILYIGQTVQEPRKRVLQHIRNGHFQKYNFEDWQTVKFFEYVQLPTYADMCIYETYLLTKLKPVMNYLCIVPDSPTVELPELGKWEPIEGLSMKPEWLVKKHSWWIQKETTNSIPASKCSKTRLTGENS